CSSSCSDIEPLVDSIASSSSLSIEALALSPANDFSSSSEVCFINGEPEMVSLLSISGFSAASKSPPNPNALPTALLAPITLPANLLSDIKPPRPPELSFGLGLLSLSSDNMAMFCSVADNKLLLSLPNSSFVKKLKIVSKVPLSASSRLLLTCLNKNTPIPHTIIVPITVKSKSNIDTTPIEDAKVNKLFIILH